MGNISRSEREAIETRILIVFERHPHGLTEIEIAQELGEERRTINNHLRRLEAESRLYKDGKYWLRFPYDTVIPRRLQLTPEEATLLYLTLRQFVKQSDKRSKIGEALLTKLAHVLSRDLRVGDDLHKAAQELTTQPYRADYEDIFRNIAHAYIYRRKLRLRYRPYRGEPFETLLSPYLIEPSSIGFAHYVIGHSSVVDAVRTYKIERIEHAEILYSREYAYEIPADFAGLELLRNAFSIFYGDEIVRVVLRFHPSVTRRVLETNWRTSLQPEWDSERQGYLRLTFEVADTTDLKPWIRTWGAHCEVLEPKSLRDEMTGEARTLAEIYGWHTDAAPRLEVDEDDPLGLADTLNSFFE